MRSARTMMRTPSTLRMYAALVAAISTACLMALLATAVKPAEAAFPGQNGKIAFTHYYRTDCGYYGCGSDSDIYTVKQNGSSLTALTKGAREDDLPAWSASGKKLAFNRGSHLYKMNANGSGLTPFINEGEQVRGGNATWSPDGTKIAFVGYFYIYIMDLLHPENPPWQLTNSMHVDSDPAWSPDGSKIAFSRSYVIEVIPGHFQCCQAPDIYTIDVSAFESESNPALRLTDTPKVGENSPSWAPLGNRIAFDRIDRRQNIDYDIYSMRSDGSDELRLTNNGAVDYQPAYSPTGRKIAFSSNRKGGYEIYVMDFDGTDQKRVTFSKGGDYEPDWQPLP
jgi:TolB protein